MRMVDQVDALVKIHRCLNSSARTSASEEAGVNHMILTHSPIHHLYIYYYWWGAGLLHNIRVSPLNNMKLSDGFNFQLAAELLAIASMFPKTQEV